MRAVSPVLPADPEAANGELRIAENQPEYVTLPALHCGQCVILTRWEFEPRVTPDGALVVSAGTNVSSTATYGDGAACERLRFERGAALKLYVLHGIGTPPREHRIVAFEPEPFVPEGFSFWPPDDDQPDPRFSLYTWRPTDEERAEILRTGSVYLYQWTRCHPVQPLRLEVEEV